MDALLAYLDMGGYARFVWPAYGLVMLTMILLLLFSLNALRARQRELSALQTGLDARRGRLGSDGKVAK